MSTLNLPYAKPFVFKMINAELEIAADPANYTLSDPIVSLGLFNTEVIIRPLIVSKLYGRHSFKYNRVKLEDLNSPIEIVVENETRLVDLIPKINALELFDTSIPSPLDFLDELGVPYIGSTEILDKPLPPFGSASQTFITMVARQNSYILNGVAEIKLIKA